MCVYARVLRECVMEVELAVNYPQASSPSLSLLPPSLLLPNKCRNSPSCVFFSARGAGSAHGLLIINLMRSLARLIISAYLCTFWILTSSPRELLLMSCCVWVDLLPSRSTKMSLKQKHPQEKEKSELQPVP